MPADDVALEAEVRGDGKFTLRTVTTPQTAGTLSVENLRLAAVFELK
jgi:hypothetical protein